MRSTMRFVASGWLALELAVGCGDGGPPQAEEASPAITGPDARAAPEGAAAPPNARAPEILVAVRDARGMPVVGRPVLVRDARGRTTASLTDEEGGIVLVDAARPYDVRVDGSPSEGANAVPTVVLGLSAEAAELALDEEDATPPPRPHTVRIGVRAADAGDHVQVVTSSASGEGESEAEGESVFSSTGSTGVVVIDVAHLLRGARFEAGERVLGHVLARDAAHDAFAHGVFDGGRVDPGARVDVGIVPLAPVGAERAHAAIDARTRTPGAREGTRVWLDLPGGGRVVLAETPAAEVSTLVPRVPGATACVLAWAEHRGTAAGDLHAGSQTTRCSPADGATPDITLDLAPPPDVLAPRADESLSRRGFGLRFGPAPEPRVHDARLLVPGRGAPLFRVLTTTPTVPFARLATLGLPRLPLGSAVLDLHVVEGRDVDRWAEPERGARGAPRLVRATSRRLAFVVTP